MAAADMKGAAAVAHAVAGEVLGYVAGHPRCTARMAGRALHIGSPAALAFLRVLARDGKVTELPADSRRAARWALPGAGPAGTP